MDNKDKLEYTRKLLEQLAEEQGIHPSRISYTSARKNLYEEFKQIGVNLYDKNSSEFNALRDRLFKPYVTDATVDGYKDKAEAKVQKTEEKIITAQKSFFKDLDAIGSKLWSNKLVVKPYQYDREAIVEREINLILSDLHFHSLLKKEQGLVEFGPEQEARRLAAVILQACEYKSQHRDNTVLTIHLLGDLFPGKIHQKSGGHPWLAAQVSAAIYLLAQGIAYAATQFRSVIVHCATGNHDRWPWETERAFVDKVDGLGTVVYFAIKQAVAHIPNVQVDIPLTPFYTYKGLGGNVFFTHGDTVINPGNPGKSINVTNVEKQVNHINSSVQEPYKLFAMGHVHVPSTIFLSSGAVFVTNGALIPPDQYAQSLGIFNSVCGQWVFESVKGHPWGDSRLATVDTNTDKDTLLDNIIKPFTGF